MLAHLILASLLAINVMASPVVKHSRDESPDEYDVIVFDEFDIDNWDGTLITAIWSSHTIHVTPTSMATPCHSSATAMVPIPFASSEFSNAPKPTPVPFDIGPNTPGGITYEIPDGGLEPGYIDPKTDTVRFANNAVWHHNIHRFNHSAPPMTWNDTLFEYAQKKADVCLFNEDPIEGLSNVNLNIAGGTYGGEHLVPNPSSMISGLWYNSEVELYPEYGVNHPNMSDFLHWGHFSQVVWRDSVQIGCGLTDCGDTWFGLCIYYPGGNDFSRMAKVGRPQGMPTVFPNGHTTI